MGKTVVLQGKTYTIPEPGDVGWGSLSDLIERLALETQALLDSSLSNPTPLRRRVREVTASPTSLLSTDDVVLVDIPTLSSINLPDGSTLEEGKVITIKDVSGAALTNTISIFPFGGATIDGSSQYDINENYGDVTVVFDGTNWARIQSLEEDYEKGLLPVGSLIPFTSHLTGSFVPPASGAVKRGLMLCDGSAIPAGQTLSGTLPDLTDNRFLMGASTSGGTGGANAQNLAHDHDFSHTHGGTTDTQTVTFTGTLSTTGGAASFNKTALNSNQNGHTHEYGLVYVNYFNAPGNPSGGNLYGLRNYPTAAWVYGTSAPFASRTVNSNAAAGTKGVSATLFEVFADTEAKAATWNFSTVNTTFTQPTLAAADIQSAQSAHDHTFSTSTQSSSTTTTSLPSSLDTRPHYFEVVYLMRVS